MSLERHSIDLDEETSGFFFSNIMGRAQDVLMSFTMQTRQKYGRHPTMEETVTEFSKFFDNLSVDTVHNQLDSLKQGHRHYLGTTTNH